MYEVTKIRDSNPVKSSDLTNQEQKNDQKGRQGPELYEKSVGY